MHARHYALLGCVATKPNPNWPTYAHFGYHFRCHVEMCPPMHTPAMLCASRTSSTSRQDCMHSHVILWGYEPAIKRFWGLGRATKRPSIHVIRNLYALLHG